MVARTPKSLRAKLEKIYKSLFDFYGPQGWWPGDSPFEVAVGAILTQNTAWLNVEKAIGNLKSNKLLDPHKLYKTSFKRLASLLTPSGYFNIKTKRLKCFLTYLIKRYDGDFHRMAESASGGFHSLREELLQVHGVGKETCDSILLYALNKPVFVVDAYTRRIFSRYGFFSEKATYDEIQDYFMKNLVSGLNGSNPNRGNPLVYLFNEYHALIVRHGKTLCRKKPLCGECPLLNVGCQFGKRTLDVRH